MEHTVNTIGLIQILKEELVKQAGVSLSETKGMSALFHYILEKLGTIPREEFDGEFCRGGDSISMKTLMRIYGKEKSNGMPSIRTLNILSRALDYKHWDDFKKQYTSTQRYLFNPEAICVEKLKEGETFILGWPEEYFMEVRYLGAYKFEVLRAKGINWKAGMPFKAKWFQLSYHYTINELGQGYELHPRIIFRTEKKKENEEFINF